MSAQPGGFFGGCEEDADFVWFHDYWASEDTGGAEQAEQSVEGQLCDAARKASELEELCRRFKADERLRKKRRWDALWGMIAMTQDEQQAVEDAVERKREEMEGGFFIIRWRRRMPR